MPAPQIPTRTSSKRKANLSAEDGDEGNHLLDLEKKCMDLTNELDHAQKRLKRRSSMDEGYV